MRPVRCPSCLVQAVVLAAWPAVASAECPTAHRVQNYTDGALTMTGWCEHYAGEGEAALITTIPAADFPIQIVRIGVGWRGTIPGYSSLQRNLKIVPGDPLGPSGTPPFLYALPDPVMVEGQITVFDLLTQPTPWIITTQPFAVWVESGGVGPNCEGGHVAHDGDGCTLDANRFKGLGFPWPYGWIEPCTSEIGGDAVIWIEYVSPTNCPVGTPSCFGDGGGTPCPCGNTGAFGRGCENSFGTGGGRLDADGVASVSSDSLRLRGTFLPPTSSALFFQGTALLAGGAGVAFGDGLRCVGGTTVRLGTNFASGGNVDFGAGVAGNPQISVAGGVPSSGGVREYQVWYRNAPAFCTPATFNLTNAVDLTWTP